MNLTGTAHFFEHLPLKAFSLLLAVMIWLMVWSERSVEVTREFPVAITGLPTGLQVDAGLPAHVNLQLSGPRLELARALSGTERLEIDLVGCQEGEVHVNVLERSLRLPASVRVVRVQPAALTLRLVRSGS